MTERKTRRQKVADRVARAAQDTPEEAANAKRLLETMEAPRLEVIASDIVSIANRTIEDEFAIGHLLNEAAGLLDPMARKRDANGKQSGSEFSDWFNAQGFPFSMKTARRLRIGAQREKEVRALIAEKTGRDMGVNTAVAQLLSPPKPSPEVESVKDATPVDPAYAALRQAYNVIARPTEDGEQTANLFTTMHADDLAASAGFIQKLAGLYTEARNAR